MLLPTKNSFVHPVLFSSIQQPINLVLGGGGMKGVAHVALLEYLEENQVPICSISGSSVGALVGAMYASGQRPADILYFFRDTPLFRYSWLNPIKGGLFDSDRYLDILKTYVFSDFADLEIPLYVVATNLHQGCPVYFREGDLYQTLLASCAVPGVFCPIEIAGELYSDGAIMDNFPLAPFLSQEQPIVGSYLCRPGQRNKSQLNSIFKVTHHSNCLLMHAANQQKFQNVDALVSYPLSAYSAFSNKDVDNIYETAKRYLKVIANRTSTESTRTTNLAPTG